MTNATNFVLHVLRRLGFFALARRLTRRHLRILCYHGVSISDEHEFRPKLFMRRETFARRLQLLQKWNYPVLPLDNALELLEQGRLPAFGTVITIDDGWAGTANIMAPLLKAHGLPATLYLNTSHAEHQSPVFDVTIAYLLWKTDAESIDLGALGIGLDGVYDLTLEAERTSVIERLIAFSEQNVSSDIRESVLAALADELGLSSELSDGRRLRMIPLEEARTLPDFGMEIQLHTHDHDFPAQDRQAAEGQIQDNRKALENVANVDPRHFCYPSGDCEPHHAKWLKELGIVSATTTNIGLNRRGENPFFLKRILDAEDISEIRLEAEMSGLMAILRSFIGR